MELRDRLLTVQDLAEFLGVPPTTLYQWRHRGEGPRGFRVGRHLRYRWIDVAEWIDRQLESGGQWENAGTTLRPRSPATHGPLQTDRLLSSWPAFASSTSWETITLQARNGMDSQAT